MMRSFTAAFLAERDFQTERMDAPDLPDAEFVGALRGLRRVNLSTGSARILWPAIHQAARTQDAEPLRVLDIGCGGGDTVVALQTRLDRLGLPSCVDGCDISAVAVDHAQARATQAGRASQFFHLDALAQPLPDHYDIIMSSLFFHHLPRAQAVEFLRKSAEAARQSVLIHDLVRSRAGWWLAYAGVRLLLCNGVCREDGPRSVECAFTEDEVRTIADEAGLTGHRVDAKFPYRFLLQWDRKC